MEGNNVYLCNWRKGGKKFKLWLDGQPGIAVEDVDFDRASAKLAEKVARLYRDQEAVVEFKPPPPITTNAPTDLEIVSLGFNEFVEALNVSSELFSDGVCKNCKTPLGKRTDLRLKIAKPPKSDVAGIRNSGIEGKLVSEKFLALLSAEEKSALQFRDVEFQSKSEIPYFEVFGNPLALFVGVKGSSYNPLSCWKCKECGSARIFPRLPPGKLFRFQLFVCSADLPIPIPRCFILGRQGMSIRLCAPMKRWEQMVGKPGTKGIATSQIGIIGEDQVDYDPPLPIYSKSERS